MQHEPKDSTLMPFFELGDDLVYTLIRYIGDVPDQVNHPDDIVRINVGEGGFIYGDSAELEEVACLYLNEELRPVGLVWMGTGTKLRVDLDPQELLYTNIFMHRNHNARLFILLHLHPDENVMPSNSDRHAYAAIAGFSTHSGVALLDSIILSRVAPDRYFSFRLEEVVDKGSRQIPSLLYSAS